jgi:N-acetylmuramoyl-L-alanine amidase
MDEEELLLDIAKRVKSLFINSDVKIYILKIKEESLQNEEAIQFVTEINADMNVIIDIAKEENGIATYYNEKYYIPFFGNEQLADHIEYYTLKETEAPVLGIFPEQEPGSLLEYLEIPAARVSIGYIWQEEGDETLDKEVYLNKIALGIYKGILESYKVMEEIEVE